MTNLVPTYWDVDGVSLDSYAMTITTLGGSRSGVPTFRGQNSKFTVKRGATHRPKIADERVITLAMQVTGTDSNNAAAWSSQQFMANWRSLQRLLWRPEAGQFSLTKRWDEGAGIISATAMAEFDSGLEPTMTGPSLAKTTVDLRLADPFFYSAQQTVTIPLNTPTVINNPGDDTVHKMTMEFNGGILSNATLTNSTPNPDVWVKLGTGIGSGDKLIVDVDRTTVLRGSDGASFVGALSHSGSRSWMGLVPGNNTLTLTASSGTGNVVVKYQIPYF